MMWTPQKTNDGKETNYGIGWRISIYKGLQVIAHGGGSVGGSTYFIIIPEKELVIAMISNTSSLGYGDLRPNLVDVFIQ